MSLELPDYYNPPLERIDKQYKGTVYIGVSGAETEIGRARDTIEHILRRPGDSLPIFHRFTKGTEARQAHIEMFLQSHHDFILFLDSDMEFPPWYLERLRAHALPCVTGLAFRRTWQPTIIPAWYEDDPELQFRDGKPIKQKWRTMMPFRGTPEPGQLYRLGATGFFGTLVHREVFEKVAELLKGELFVLEDSMFYEPHDPFKVARGEEQLEILRGQNDRVGADVRLSYWIRRAGYTIWGDPGAHAGHFLHYPIGLTDWSGVGKAFRKQFAERTSADLAEIRQKEKENFDALTSSREGHYEQNGNASIGTPPAPDC